MTDDGHKCQCKKDQYIDINDLECVSCRRSDILGGCVECTDEEDFCFRCEEGKYMTEDNICTNDHCAFSLENGECITCNRDFKGNTLVPQFDLCVKNCSAPFEFNKYQNTCELNCQKGTFLINGKCQECPENCGDCIDDTQCIECQPDLKCDLNCPEGTIYDYEGEGKCVEECSA